VDCDKFTAFAGLYHFVKPVDFETSPGEDKVRLRLRQGSGDAVEPHGPEAHFRRQDGLARHSGVVRGICYRVLRDASEADDLVQDVFLLVHRNCKTFDCSKAPARFWILQMAYRRAISRRRYLISRHFYTRLDIDDAANELADPGAAPARLNDSIDGKLENGSLQKVFGGLSEDQQKTLRLFYRGLHLR
jgi:RNA polymerase sigma factor (sigma-70 family)